jgi:hypothetical protein
MKSIASVLTLCSVASTMENFTLTYLKWVHLIEYMDIRFLTHQNRPTYHPIIFWEWWIYIELISTFLRTMIMKSNICSNNQWGFGCLVPLFILAE